MGRQSNLHFLKFMKLTYPALLPPKLTLDFYKNPMKKLKKWGGGGRLSFLLLKKYKFGRPAASPKYL
jgi:hypothetical protein